MTTITHAKCHVLIFKYSVDKINCVFTRSSRYFVKNFLVIETVLKLSVFSSWYGSDLKTIKTDSGVKFTINFLQKQQKRSLLLKQRRSLMANEISLCLAKMFIVGPNTKQSLATLRDSIAQILFVTISRKDISRFSRHSENAECTLFTPI